MISWNDVLKLAKEFLTHQKPVSIDVIIIFRQKLMII